MYEPSCCNLPSSLPFPRCPHRRPGSPPPTAAPPFLLRFRAARATSSDDPGNGGGGGGDALAGIAGGQVDELLRREENRPLLDGLEAASRRVQLARQALADIKKQEDEVSRAKDVIRKLQNQESQIAESQKELLEARALVDEAEQSLSSDIGRMSLTNDLTEDKAEDIDRDAERLESLKAAVVSSITGTLAALPFSSYQATSDSQLIQNLVIVFISCFLFGTTFRYAIRRDLDNIHLKTGTSAAFGTVKGLAALEPANLLDFNTINLPQVFDRAVYLSESVSIFIFSAIALDFCFKAGILSPFPIRK